MNNAVLAALRPFRARLPVYSGVSCANASFTEKFLSSTACISSQARSASARSCIVQQLQVKSRAFSCSTWKCKKHVPHKSRPRAPPNPPKISGTTPIIQQPKKHNWRDYDDEDGMPLTNGDLSASEVESIFGPSVPAKLTNHVLRVLQYRRESGTLAEYGIGSLGTSDHASFDNDFHMKALEFLRETYPVDEEAAAARWAEEEAIRLEHELLSRGQKLGLYKRDPEDDVQDYQPQGTSYGQRYAVSGLESIRKENERKFEEQQRKEEEERELAAAQQLATRSNVVSSDGNTSVSQIDKANVDGGNFALPSLQRAKQYAALRQAQEGPKWYQKYKEQAEKDAEESRYVLELSPFRRLAPSYLVGGLTILLSIAFATFYEPPPKYSRLWPDLPPSAATCVSILLLNAAVFVAWRVPPLWRFMSRYFIQVPGYPVAVTAVTNVFSHQSFRHIAINMFTLFLVGPLVHERMGRGDFLALYMTSGVAGSLASLTWFTMTRNLVTMTLGASGAICGTMIACVLLHNTNFHGYFSMGNERLTIPFLDIQVPVSAAILWPVIVGGEIIGMRRGYLGGTDFISHFGGYAVGTLGSLWWLWHKKHQAREREASVLRSVHSVLDNGSKKYE